MRLLPHKLELAVSKLNRAAALDVKPRTHVSGGQRGGHRYAMWPPPKRATG
jgi:hypothetical protein